MVEWVVYSHEPEVCFQNPQRLFRATLKWQNYISNINESKLYWDGYLDGRIRSNMAIAAWLGQKFNSVLVITTIYLNGRETNERANETDLMKTDKHQNTRQHYRVHLEYFWLPCY